MSANLENVETIDDINQSRGTPLDKLFADQKKELSLLPTPGDPQAREVEAKGMQAAAAYLLTKERKAQNNSLNGFIDSLVNFEQDYGSTAIGMLEERFMDLSFAIKAWQQRHRKTI